MENRKYSILGFHDRLNQAVEESGLSQAEIARRTGLHRHTVLATESAMPNSGTLAKLCAVLHVSADWLLGLSNVRRKV